MVIVAQAQSTKSLWVVTDNYRVHALGDGDLPRIILARSPGSAALVKSCSFGVLVADGLPAEGAKNFSHSRGVGCACQHLGRSHRGDPKLRSGIARGPCSRGSASVRSDLVEEVDDE